MRYLALDYGRRRTGVALSDESGQWAFPHATWEGWSRQRLIDETLQLIGQFEVQCVVLGLPLATGEGNAGTANSTGGGNAPEMQQPVLQLQALLQTALQEAQLEVTVQCWDERFSTALVLRQLREVGISQRAAREDTGSGSMDARAAAAILQHFLDGKINRP